MLKIIMSALVLLILETVVSSAAVVKDQTCTRKDGTTYQCSAKQHAAHDHIVACGKQWKADKADQAVKSAGWPAYWHKCSEQMKARDLAGR